MSEELLIDIKKKIESLISVMDRNKIKDIMTESRFRIDGINCLKAEQLFQCYFAHELKKVFENEELLVLTEVPIYNSGRCDVAVLKKNCDNLNDDELKDSEEYMETTHHYPQSYLKPKRKIFKKFCNCKEPLVAIELKTPGSAQFKTFKNDLKRVSGEDLPKQCLRYAIMIDSSEDGEYAKKNEERFRKLEAEQYNCEIVLLPRDRTKFIEKNLSVVATSQHLTDAGRIARL